MTSHKRCFASIIGSFAVILFACSKDDLPIPACIKGTFPVNGESVPQGELITLRWQNSTNASGYDVFLAEGANEPELIAENVEATEYEVQVSATANTMYTWYVSPKNADGQRAECSGELSSFWTKELPAVETTPIEVNVLGLEF
jgi:hypothetical protein